MINDLFYGPSWLSRDLGVPVRPIQIHRYYDDITNLEHPTKWNMLGSFRHYLNTLRDRDNIFSEYVWTYKDEFYSRLYGNYFVRDKLISSSTSVLSLGFYRADVVVPSRSVRALKAQIILSTTIPTKSFFSYDKDWVKLIEWFSDISMLGRNFTTDIGFHE